MSFQCVTFVDSRNRTHDKNVASNGSQKNSAKTTRKYTTERIQSQKTRNFLGGCCTFTHMTTCNFLKQEKKTRRRMSYSVLGSVSGCKPPSSSHCRQKRFHKFEKIQQRRPTMTKKTKRIWQKKETGLVEGFIIPQKQL